MLAKPWLVGRDYCPTSANNSLDNDNNSNASKNKGTPKATAASTATDSYNNDNDNDQDNDQDNDNADDNSNSNNNNNRGLAMDAALCWVLLATALCAAAWAQDAGQHPVAGRVLLHLQRQTLNASCSRKLSIALLRAASLSLVNPKP